MWRYLLCIPVLLCLLTAGVREEVELDRFDERSTYFEAFNHLELSPEEVYEMQVDYIKREIHNVQLAVERFSVDNSDDFDSKVYPHSVNQLVVLEKWKGEFINYDNPGFYPNPLTASAPDELNAICVPFGWSSIAPGNYSYLTYRDDTGVVRGYMILGYGPTRQSKYDLDGDGMPEGVILIVSCGGCPIDWGEPLELYDNGDLVNIDLSSAAPEAIDLAELPQTGPLPEVEFTKERSAVIKQNLHAIQLSLERWAVDRNGFYPWSVNQIIAPYYSDYWKEMTSYAEAGFDDNPLHSGSDMDMRCVPYGWTPESPGNFSYLPQFDEFGMVVGYMLVGWGTMDDDSIDMDGDGVGDGPVILLNSGVLRHELEHTPQAFEYYDSGRRFVFDFSWRN